MIAISPFRSKIAWRTWSRRMSPFWRAEAMTSVSPAFGPFVPAC
jgi:hypothetical protein